MERKAVARKMKARALTAPEPSFVSLVRAGANQTPYRVVKMDADAAAARVQENMTMAGKVDRKIARKAGMDVAMLVFKGEKFADEATVRKWLDNGGFEGAEIVAKKDKDTTYFEVTSKMEFITGTIKKVAGVEEGLTVFVGKTASEPVEKTDEEKVDEKVENAPSAVSTADGKVVKEDEVQPTVETPATEAKDEVVKTEGDGGTQVVQPVAETPAPAETTATEVVKEDALAETKAIVAKADAAVAEIKKKGLWDVSRLGEVVLTLRYMVEDAEYSNIPEAAVNTIKSAAQALLSALAVVMQDTLDSMVDALKHDKAAPVAKADEAPAAPAPVVDEPAPAAKSEQEAVVKEDSVAKALATLTEAVTSLTGVVKAQGETLAEVTVKVKSDAEAHDARLKVLEGTGQSRKGADAEDTAPAKKTEDVKKAEDATAVRRMRASLGSYRASQHFGS